MKHKLKQVIAGTLLSACVSVTSAGEPSSILGAIEYQAMSRQAMAQIVGTGGAIGGGVDSWRTARATGAYVEIQPGNLAGGAGDITMQAGQSGGISSGGEF